MASLAPSSGAVLDNDFQFADQAQFDASLNLAVFDGHVATVLLMLEKFAGQFTPNEDDDPLQAALYERQEGKARELLESYRDINKQTGYFGNALQAAVFGRNIDLVKVLVEKGASIDVPGRFGYPLRAAVVTEDFEIVQWLLVEKNANPNADDRKLGDCLQAAALKGNLEIMTLLLEHKAHVNGYGGVYKSPLQAAAFAGYEQAVELLLENYAEIGSEGRFRDALQAAVYGGHERIVRLLLQRGAELNPGPESRLDSCHIDDRSSIEEKRKQVPQYSSAEVNLPSGVGPLEIAARWGNLPILKLLLHQGAILDVGAEPGEKYHCPFTALQIAAFWGHEEAVSFLLNEGAQVKAIRRVFGTTLQAALEKSHFHLCELLLQAGADIDQDRGQFGTCFQIFCERGDMAAVQFLCDHGADMENSGGDYGNALQVASDLGRLEVVQFLIDKGARVNAPGRLNGNALQAASGSGHLGIVRLLLSNGADINALGGNKGTALQAASSRGHIDIARLLLQLGAHIDVMDDNLGSALHLAAFYGHDEVVRLLLDNGADILLQHNIPKSRVRRMWGHGAVRLGDALFAATWEGHAGTVGLLLEKHSRSFVETKTLPHALKRAIIAERTELATLLLEKGFEAGLEAKDCCGALNVACQKANVLIAELLLDKGVDINGRDSENKSALHGAAKCGRRSVVAMLVSRGVDVNSPSYERGVNISPLTAAVLHFNVSFSDYIPKDTVGVIRVLVDAGADVSGLREHSGTLARDILQTGDTSLLQLLHTKGLDVSPKIDTPEYSQMLESAIHLPHVEILRYLLGPQFVHDDHDHRVDTYYARALSMAVRNGRQGDVEIILGLISPSYSLETSDSNPLVVVGMFGECPTILELLLRHFHPLKRDVFNYVLLRAVECSQNETVKILLQYAADQNWTIDFNHLLLLAAPGFRHSKVVDILLQAGADPNSRNEKGQTALLLASASAGSQEGATDSARLLLLHGADINAECRVLGTPLHAAVQDACGPIFVEDLIKAGANVNALAGYYGTALEAAMTKTDASYSCTKHDCTPAQMERTYGILLQGYIETALVLLDHGAEVNAQGGYYGNALQAAVHSENLNGVRLLLQRGADVNAQGGHYGSALKAARSDGSDLFQKEIEQTLLIAGALDSDLEEKQN